VTFGLWGSSTAAVRGADSQWRKGRDTEQTVQQVICGQKATVVWIVWRDSAAAVCSAGTAGVPAEKRPTAADAKLHVAVLRGLRLL
jgi:hypothetical protein